MTVEQWVTTLTTTSEDPIVYRVRLQTSWLLVMATPSEEGALARLLADLCLFALRMGLENPAILLKQANRAPLTLNLSQEELLVALSQTVNFLVNGSRYRRDTLLVTALRHLRTLVYLTTGQPSLDVLARGQG